MADTYEYFGRDPDCTADYLWDAALQFLGDPPARILEIGCGNGAFSRRLMALGFDAFGFDESGSGIEISKVSADADRFWVQSVYEEGQAEKHERFDAVVSLEVIEHLAQPRALLRLARRVLGPGGRLILTTPYHGHLKNLAIVASGRFDRHFSPLWDLGHLRFFSFRTMRTLLEQESFLVVRQEGVGRVPLLWKSLIVEAVRAPEIGPGSTESR